MEIVGVVADTLESLSDPPYPTIYYPFYAGAERSGTLTIHGQQAASGLALSVQQAIASAVAVNIVLTLISSSLRPRCNRALLRQRLRGQPTRRNPGAPPLGKCLNLNAVYRRFIDPCRPISLRAGMAHRAPSGPHSSRRKPADLPQRQACDRLRLRSRASRPAAPLS